MSLAPRMGVEAGLLVAAAGSAGSERPTAGVHADGFSRGLKGCASVGASVRLAFHTIARPRGRRIKMSATASRALNCPRQLVAEALCAIGSEFLAAAAVRFLHSRTAPHPWVLQS